MVLTTEQYSEMAHAVLPNVSPDRRTKEMRKLMCEFGMRPKNFSGGGGNYKDAREPEWTMTEYMKDGIAQWGTMNPLTKGRRASIQALRDWVAKNINSGPSPEKSKTYIFDPKMWNCNGYVCVCVCVCLCVCVCYVNIDVYLCIFVYLYLYFCIFVYLCIFRELMKFSNTYQHFLAIP